MGEEDPQGWWIPLYGLDRDELECWNVGEMANPHLPFPRVCIHRAYTKEGRKGERRRGRVEDGGKATKKEGGGEEKDEEEERETSARACTEPVCLLSAPLPLSAVLIPAIFN